MLHRRTFLRFATFVSGASLLRVPLAQAQSEAKARTRIVFLGTKGGPRVEIGRSNPANLIEINGTRIVLDCGMGVSHQLAGAKVPLASVKYILISHHHSDHAGGIRPFVALGARPVVHENAAGFYRRIFAVRGSALVSSWPKSANPDVISRAIVENAHDG